MQVAGRRSRWLSGAKLALVASLWSMVLATGQAAEVFFPATSAYNRHNYDPFDTAPFNQANSAVFETPTEEQGDEIQLQSQVHLIAAERFTHASAPPANQVVPAALQAVPPTSNAEVLPPPHPTATTRHPDQHQLGSVNEPGANWSPTPLADLTTNTVLPSGVLPRDYWTERAPQHVAFFDPGGRTRGWPVNTFNWVASCSCSNPLYFEEINLERYGYGCGCFGPCCSSCVQSAVSGAHFFANVIALPYKMGVDCPGDCDYTLGHYRPGSCPPWQWHCCTRCGPLGGLTAGGVAVGLIFLIP
jgi:hypothetical protein